MNMTTEQMKAALAKANPSVKVTSEPISVADVLANTAAGIVATIEESGSTTSKFFDRVKTRYQFNRAVAKGLLPDPEKVRARPATSKV